MIDSITKPLHARKTAPLSEHLDDLLVDKDVRHPGSQDTSLDDISISKHSKTSAIALKNAQAIKQTDVLKVGILEGTTFLNDYIVVDTLGRGSFGKVKLCLNVGDTQLYAVKVIETQQVGDLLCLMLLPCARVCTTLFRSLSFFLFFSLHLSLCLYPCVCFLFLEIDNGAVVLGFICYCKLVWSCTDSI